ncbi:hypothetical protein [Streptomyces sp. NPDC057794]|uniref:hypothetical protein n=1 Tax=Streptomyces sp. NPDC057794 TaxID=3346251 RepID=UPI00367A966E
MLGTGNVPSGGILPRRVETLRLYGTLPLSGYCEVTLGRVDEDRYSADFRLWADDGSVAADATGVEFAHVPAESAEERFAHHLLQAAWEPAEPLAPRPATGGWLLLAEEGRESFAAALGEALGTHHAAVSIATLTGEDGTAPLPVKSHAGQALQAVVYLPAPGAAPPPPPGLPGTEAGRARGGNGSRAVRRPR